MINFRSPKLYVGAGLVFSGTLLGTLFSFHQNMSSSADICVVGVDCPGSNPIPEQPQPTSVVQEQVNNQGSSTSPVQTLPTPTPTPVVAQTIQVTPEPFKPQSPCN